MINQMGFCTSSDTLEWFLEHVSKEQAEQGIQQRLVENAFSVVSVDSIDFHAPYAVVTALMIHVDAYGITAVASATSAVSAPKCNQKMAY